MGHPLYFWIDLQALWPLRVIQGHNMTEQGSGRETPKLTCILPRRWKVYFEPLVRYPAAYKDVSGSRNKH